MFRCEFPKCHPGRIKLELEMVGNVFCDCAFPGTMKPRERNIHTYKIGKYYLNTLLGISQDFWELRCDSIAGHLTQFFHDQCEYFFIISRISQLNLPFLNQRQSFFGQANFPL